MLVLHDEYDTSLAIESVYEDEIIRAEVKHKRDLTGDAVFIGPRPIRSADEGLSRRTSPVEGISSQSGA